MSQRCMVAAAGKRKSVRSKCSRRDLMVSALTIPYLLADHPRDIGARSHASAASAPADGLSEQVSPLAAMRVNAMTIQVYAAYAAAAFCCNAACSPAATTEHADVRSKYSRRYTDILEDVATRSQSCSCCLQCVCPHCVHAGKGLICMHLAAARSAARDCGDCMGPRCKRCSGALSGHCMRVGGCWLAYQWMYGVQQARRHGELSQPLVRSH